METKLHKVAGNVGVGLVAGFIGTIAITASRALDAKLSGKTEPEVGPAKAAEKTFEIEPEDQQAEERLAQLVHWTYGTAFGAARGLLDLVGVRGMTATLIHAGAVQAAASGLLPALSLKPPVQEEETPELVREVAHHLVYALAAGIAYEALMPSDPTRALADRVTPLLTTGVAAAAIRQLARRAPELRERATRAAEQLRERPEVQRAMAAAQR